MSESATVEQPATSKPRRSAEEGEMRDIIVPQLRKRWPGARIIHELPLRYSSNRIDIAAVTPDQIVGVEIKSSRDVHHRLEAQLRAFMPVCVRLIVALAPKWNEKRPQITKPSCDGGTIYLDDLTEAQEIIRRVGGWKFETWTVDSGAASIEITEQGYDLKLPWPVRLLDMLHVSELVEVGTRHRCWVSRGSRVPRHDLIRDACAELMTGQEVRRAACRALRARAAFAAESDPPIRERDAP